MFNWVLSVCQAPILSAVSINFPFCRWRQWGSKSWSNMQLVSGRGGTRAWAWHLTPEHRTIPAHSRTDVSPTPSTSEDWGCIFIQIFFPHLPESPFRETFLAPFFCNASEWQSHSHDGLAGHLVHLCTDGCDLEPRFHEMTSPSSRQPMTG